MNAPRPPADFYQAFRGHFSSLLNWEDLDAFWQTVRARADAGWYIYAIGLPLPQQPASAADVERFIERVNHLLRMTTARIIAASCTWTTRTSRPSSRFRPQPPRRILRLQPEPADAGLDHVPRRPATARRVARHPRQAPALVADAMGIASGTRDKVRDTRHKGRGTKV